MHATRFIVALTALATIAACGKTDNLPSERLLEFPNVLPEKPVELSGASYEPWTSSRSIATRGEELLVVDTDNDTLVVMDQAGLTVVATVEVGSRPEHVVVGPEGNAWVTVRGAGEVVRIAPDNTIAARAEVGSEPFALALRTTDGTRLYVSLSEDDAVVALDPMTLALSELAQVLDTPRGLVLAGNHLHVIHHHEDALVLPLGNYGSFQRDGAGQALAASASLRRGVPSDHMANRGGLANSFPARALAGTVHPQTGEVLIAHVEAHPGTEGEFLEAAIDALDPSQEVVVTSGYGSTATGGTRFNVPTRPIETSVTSVRSNGVTNTTFSDHPVQDPKTGEPITHLVAQPSDINHHPTHSLALVTGYGSDQVLVLNTNSPDPMLSPLGLIEVDWAPKAVTFSADGTRAFVLNHQSFTVSEVDLTPFFGMKTLVKLPVLEEDGFDRGFAPMMDEPMEGEMAVEPSTPYTRSANTAEPLNLRAKRSASYGADPRTAAVKRGQRVFTFARNGNMSHAGQFACATCHFEGREDKLVWVIDDGPRQTPALAGRLKDTAPFNWAGTKPQLQGNMVQTVERMGGQGLTGDEIADLEAFLLSMDAVPNPNLAADGTLSEMQAWGKEIFFRQDVGCGTCHAGPAQTDGRNHDVGTATEIEREVFQRKKQAGVATGEGPAVLNTPTLRGLFYTAPYLHDGSAETLHDVLELAPEMGHPGILSAEEKDALVAYLLTL